MQSFGSSLGLFGQSCGIGLVQFGYTSGVWTKQMVACNAFGSQRRNCIFQSPALVVALRRNGRGSNRDLPVWDWEWRGLTGHQRHLHRACRDDWQLCGSEANTGVARVWGHRELDTLAPERTNKNTLIELHVFQKRERGYISYISFPFFFLFLSLCLEVLVLSLKKSFWGINTLKKLFSFPLVFFFFP